MKRTVLPLMAVALFAACNDEIVEPQTTGQLVLTLELPATPAVNATSTTDGTALELVSAPATDAQGRGLLRNLPVRDGFSASSNTASAAAIPVLDLVEVTLSGPTDTTVTLQQSGGFFEGTIDSLLAGNYSVLVLGFGNGPVTYYGRTGGVNVTAGNVTQANVPFNVFEPTLTQPASPTTNFTFALNWTTVPDADNYTVEFDVDPSFSNPTPTGPPVTGTSTFLIADGASTFYLRVRAANSDVTASEASPSNVVSVEVTPDGFNNNDQNSAFDLGTGTNAINGRYDLRNIASGSEEDWYSFTSAAGELLIANVFTTSLPVSSNLNPFIRMLDAGGTEIASNDDFTGVESRLDGIPLPATGTYFLVVSSADGSVGHYELDVRLTTNNPVATVVVTPSAASINVGGTIQLNATLLDAGGVELFGRTIDWTSSSTGIATVDANGLVSGVADGVVAIAATSEGVSGFSSVTVGNPSAPTVTSISAGLAHTCATLTNGAAYCWGSNSQGQLGNGTTNNSASPVLVSGGEFYIGVSAAHDGSSGVGYHTCAGTVGGDITCWGANGSGQIGDGTNNSTTTPSIVAGGHTFLYGDAGSAHNCAIDDTGIAWCWGDNGFGQLGNGTNTDSNQPVEVSGSKVFDDISVGTDHSCGVVAADGTVWCWGFGGYGELGDGLQSNSNVPVQASVNATFVYVSAGDHHTCAVDDVGDAYCWGWNVNGQLGSTSAPDQCLGTEACEDVPVLVEGGKTWDYVSAGHRFSCGIDVAGDAFCFGQNTSGKLGVGADQGTLSESAAPLGVAGGLTFFDISAGRDHACGYTVAGEAFCWGAGGAGQIGDGVQADTNTPVRVGSPLQ